MLGLVTRASPALRLALAENPRRINQSKPLWRGTSAAFPDPERPLVAFGADIGGWVLVGHMPDGTGGVVRTGVKAVRAPTREVEAMLDEARIRRAGEGLFLQDAGSSNGTLVKGDVVGNVDVAIVHGDLIRFGSVLLQRFEPQRLHSVLERFVHARR